MERLSRSIFTLYSLLYCIVIIGIPRRRFSGRKSKEGWATLNSWRAAPGYREPPYIPTLAIYGKLPNLTGTIVLREYTSPRPLTLPLPPSPLPLILCPRNLDRVPPLPPSRRQSKRENAIIDRNISSLPPSWLYRPDDFNLDPGDRDHED